MNWGNKILVTFLVFIGGMGYLVYRCMHTDFQLVEKEYYKSEIAYQQVIDGSKAADELSKPVHIFQTAQGLGIQMPIEMSDAATQGNVWFYCAYEQRNDKKFALQTNSNGLQIITAGTIIPGSYTVKIDWQNNGKKYYTEKNILVD
jgi:hypothetical protein